MKYTKKKVVFSILEFIFVAVVPIALIITQCCTISQTEAAQKFEIGFGGMVLLIVVFWIIKKLYIDKALSNANQQSNNLLADLKVETDAAKIANIEKSLKDLRTLEFFARCVQPVLVMVAVILCFNALEDQLIKLSGCLKIVLASYAISCVFGLLNAREVVSKNKKE